MQCQIKLRKVLKLLAYSLNNILNYISAFYRRHEMTLDFSDMSFFEKRGSSESGKKSSSSETHRKPHFIGDPTYRFIGDLNILIGNPNIFIGDPNILIGDPNIFTGDPYILIRDPNILIGDPNIFIGDPNISSETPIFSSEYWGLR